jgi:hypothetical protein
MEGVSDASFLIDGMRDVVEEKRRVLLTRLPKPTG